MSLFQKITCHGCGAPVEFKTTSSLVAVCPFCSTVVAKSQEDIEAYSKKSSVIQDFSKIQIGTTGRFKTHSFTVIGRIQLKYYYGFWNEWFILFDNGLTGWLSDVLDEYIITIETNNQNKEILKEIWNLNFEDLNFDSSNNKLSVPISFSKVEVGKNYFLNNQLFFCQDISVGEIVGAQGEIAFNVNKNPQFKAVDLKKDNQFVTIDYSEEGKSPIVYIGESFPESELFLSNTRTLEEINNSNGAYKGKITSLKCPNCGSSNPKVNGVSNTLFCISCNSKLDISNNTVEILIKTNSLEGGKYEQPYSTTLKCGDKGNIRGKKYLVIGVVLKNNPEYPEYEWVEYLLYQSGGSGNYIWLVEDRSDINAPWKISKAINDLPKDNLSSLTYKTQTYTTDDESIYSGKTLAVWGAFNWEINVNDVIDVVDFYSSNKKVCISKEIIVTDTHQEVSYSYLVDIPKKEIYDGFKVKNEDVQISPVDDEESSDSEYSFFNSFYFISFFILLVILSPIMSSLIIGLILAVIFWFIQKEKQKKHSEQTNKTIQFGLMKFIFLIITIILFLLPSKNGNSSNSSGSSFRSGSSYGSGHK